MAQSSAGPGQQCQVHMPRHTSRRPFWRASGICQNAPHEECIRAPGLISEWNEQVEGEDGLMLSGTWTDGKFGFKGKWVWQDNVYKGGFKEGYFFGRGKFKWSTGESLLADFDTDCPSRGLLRTASGMRKVTFDGLTPLFSSSKPHTLLPFERFSEAITHSEFFDDAALNNSSFEMNEAVLSSSTEPSPVKTLHASSPSSTIQARPTPLNLLPTTLATAASAGPAAGSDPRDSTLLRVYG